MLLRQQPATYETRFFTETRLLWYACVQAHSNISAVMHLAYALLRLATRQLQAGPANSQHFIERAKSCRRCSIITPSDNKEGKHMHVPRVHGAHTDVQLPVCRSAPPLCWLHRFCLLARQYAVRHSGSWNTRLRVMIVIVIIIV
jgi:hypothetical protein